MKTELFENLKNASENICFCNLKKLDKRNKKKHVN